MVKYCPVCATAAFEDASVCYGCLHRFDLDEADHEACSTRTSYDTHPGLVKRVIAVSKWSPVTCYTVTEDNCNILESIGSGSDADWVAFRVNGCGFTIDFINLIVCRDTAYDAVC